MLQSVRFIRTYSLKIKWGSGVKSTQTENFFRIFLKKNSAFLWHNFGKLRGCGGMANWPCSPTDSEHTFCGRRPTKHLKKLQRAARVKVGVLGRDRVSANVLCGIW